MEKFPPPQIEHISRQQNFYATSNWQPPWYRSRRFIVFSSVFLLSLLISQAYNFSRPAVFQSSATLLTIANTAIDQFSHPDMLQTGADREHVAIQEELLLGPSLIAKTAKKLQQTENISLPVSDIRDTLDVKPVPGTNLVKMVAEGLAPDILPLLINAWIDVYLQESAVKSTESANSTQLIIKDELANLREKIEAKRAELNQFMLSSGITSTERVENPVLARINGLNESLNLASEEEVKAKARLDALKIAIKHGQSVAAEQDQRTISALETKAQELREKIAEIRQQFTDDYINLDPSKRFMPLELKKLESKLQKLRNQGQLVALSQAQQAYRAARQSVQTIQDKIDKLSQQAGEFSSRFQQHESLKTDLEGLEAMYRETQEKLVKLGAKQAANYPQIEIIDRAYRTQRPNRPDYTQDAMIATGGSFLLALLSVFLAEFLTRKPQNPEAFTVPGIHIHTPPAQDALPQQPQYRNLAAQNQYALDAPLEKEFSTEQLRIVYQTSSLKGRQLLALLLTGLTLEESTLIERDDFDFPNHQLAITGATPRVITVPAIIHSLFEHSSPCPLWKSTTKATAKELAALLTCMANDAGIPDPEEFSAEAIRHSYIIYLLQQGLRLQDLEQILGHINPVTLSRYRIFSQPGSNPTLSEINLVHPALKNIG